METVHFIKSLEETLRIGYGTTDWFQIGKGVCQGCILSPCLFNSYAEYIMKNAGLEETQAGIKIARRNINNLRYADDTTLMAESEEELKSLLTKVKEESGKVGLKLNIQKMKIMASGPITSWEIDGETVVQWQILCFWAPKITAYGDCSHEIKRCLVLGRKVMTNLRWEPARESPPMTRSCRRDLMGKADQDSGDPLDLLEHLPQNQNLSVLLFCAIHQLF